MPLSSLLCLGLSHRTAPVALRERLRLGPAAREAFLAAARDAGRADGLAVLSTCGRTEVYADGPDASGALTHALTAALAEASGLDADALADHLYRHDGEAAARHLCRVAAGLDSVVLGEPEVLGQVTEAWSAAAHARATSPRLRRAFEAAVRAGRRARRETAINRGATGLGALAATLARRHYGTLEGRHVIVVGTGTMGRSVLRALEGQPAGRLTVASRRIETAMDLADAHGGHASCLPGFRRLLADADVVIAATAAETALVDAELVAGALAGRPDRPLLLIDLGLPRNIDARVADVLGVTLVDLDGLQTRAERARAARRAETPRVEAIIDEEIGALRARERGAAAEPVIRALRGEAERIRREALDQTLRHLPALDDAARAHLGALTHRLVNRLLHHPTDALRREAADAASASNTTPLADAARTLFHLPPPHDGPAPLRHETLAPRPLADAARPEPA